MKSNLKKRILALMLCMVMVLSSATSVLADDANAGNMNQVEEKQKSNNEPAAISEGADSTEKTQSESEKTSTEQETKQETPQPATEVPQQHAPAAETPQQNEQPAITESAPVQEAVELKQDMKDADGNVNCTVTANIPEGTFSGANTSDVTMEVTEVETQTAEEIKGLIEKGLAEDKILGEYFLYKISFKVKGETAEPGREIKITFEEKDFKIGDVKKANIFYYNEANSTAGNTEAEINEIIQKSEKIEELQNAGQSTDNIEDYDLSEITLKADQTAEKIQTEGRRSTVYGCYIEENKPEEVTNNENTPAEEAPAEEPKEEPTETVEPAEVMQYEDDDVIVTVSADEKGIIPENSKLQVVPISPDDSKTKDQYKEVEEQLNQKAEVEEYDIAGFLAYDISFINENGEEVEPSGNVKVTIDYKKEAIPEGVEEDGNLDVTVMHLEENNKGDVKEVVDMVADDTKAATVETTDTAKVKKAEFETGSFSAFTITWILGGYNTKKINIKFLDNVRYEIDVDDNCEALGGITLYTGQEFLMKDITARGKWSQFYEITDTDGTNYTFTKAVNNWNWKEGDTAGETDIAGLNYADSQVKWKNANSGKYHDYYKDDTFYFIYTKKEAGIKKVSTESDNIDISLYNYNSKINDEDYNRLIEKGFGFYSIAGVDGTGDYKGTYTNSNNQGVFQGIVKKNLRGEKPVLATGDSMGFLFGSGDNGAVKKYENLSGLFQRNANGYYYYDSVRNAAVLNGNTIDVYDGTVSPEGFNYGNFLPFNNEYLSGTNGLSFIPQEYTDMWFGMNVGMSFYQPKNGRIDNQDMVFEFRGDDDVWVFIDGMLVLDIGGIHGKKNGSINFRTGEVVVEGNERDETFTTTLAECYRAAYEELNMSDYRINRKLATLFNKENGEYTSFKNYSSHKFEFFYLERGGGAANCRIKFNMPRIPEGSVMVTKEVINKDNETVDYSEDIDFHFNIKKNNSIMANTLYKLYENNKMIGTGTTDAEGNFILKHGQSAVFENFIATDKYEVTEFGAYLNGYEITYNGEIAIESTETEGSTIIKSATTGSLSVDETPSTVFRNKVTDTANLLIKKELASGNEGLEDKEFPIQIVIQGKPYVGSYSKGGISYTTENGKVTIKAGETIQITGLPYGTSFDIREELDGSYIPTYSISGDAYDKLLPEFDGDGMATNDVISASGKIAGDSIVTVENEKVEVGTGTTSVKVTKEWKDFRQYEIPEYVDVTLYVDSNRNGEYDESIDTLVPERETKSLSSKNNWSCEWINLPADTDFVVKETYPEGFELFDTTITNSITAVETIGKRVTPNREMLHTIGKNNILLVKQTKDKYFLWTPIDLKLSQAEIDNIVDLIIAKHLEGTGNIGGNVTYKHGADSNDGISLEPNSDGWTLEFAAKNQWAMFWTFGYTRIQSIHLENTIDRDLETQISLKKVWQGDTELDRPDSITVQLYKNGIPERDPVVVTSSTDWKHTFANLPYYNYNSQAGKYIKNQYDIKEVKIGNEDVDENGQAADYQSTVTKDENGNVIITNAKQWQIVKVSAQSNDLKLQGAVFKLWSGIAADAPIYGKSDENGVVTWYEDLGCITPMKGFIPDGTYNLTEEQAPVGYLKSNEVWEIIFSNGIPTTITSTKGNVEGERVEGKLTYYYENTAVYDLPNAGGSGIYWYSIGGMLLMIAAALILYKNKCREVLES